jgi:hypothetical protein
MTRKKSYKKRNKKIYISIYRSILAATGLEIFLIPIISLTVG